MGRCGWQGDPGGSFMIYDLEDDVFRHPGL